MIARDEIAGFPLFAEIEAGRLEHVVQRAADIVAGEGEYLMHEGEAPAFFVLLDGKLEVTKRAYAHEQVIDKREMPGEYFGEVPLLLGSAALANLRAVADSRVMRIEAPEFRWLFRDSPAFHSMVLESASRRITGVQEFAAEQPPATAIVVGRRWDDTCHDLRDFLSRNQISFEFFDIDDPIVPSLIDDFEARREHCPLVKLCDGRLLEAPTLRKLAEAVELPVAPRQTAFDVAILGAGPAGLAAAVYGASEGLSTLLIECEAPGGQAGTSSRIENYLGFPNGLSGDELAERALRQARRFGADIVVTRKAQAIRLGEERHRVELDGGETIDAGALVITTGVTWRTLDVPGLAHLVGRGVFYGAARSEAHATHGKEIYLVGAGNSAGQAAMFFSGYARSVTLLVRGDNLAKSMSDYLIKELRSRANVHVALQTEVVAAHGEHHLEAIDVRDNATGKIECRPTETLFVFIGADSGTEWLPREIARDSHGYVLTGLHMREAIGGGWPLKRAPFFLETSVPGVFAAGDVRADSMKRIAASVGEGSMSISFVHQHFEDVRARQLVEGAQHATVSSG